MVCVWFIHFKITLLKLKISEGPVHQFEVISFYNSEEGEDVRQLGNDMFEQEPGYNGDRNLDSFGVF